MIDPKFKEIRPNYRKNVLEVTLTTGGKTKTYRLPFAAIRHYGIGPTNRFVSITIDKELNSQGAVFTLESGKKGSFPSDLVLYHCEPSYAWSPLNQVKRALTGNLGRSKLSSNVLGDALKKSPAKVRRLLEKNRNSKYLPEILRLAEAAGYRVEFRLKKKGAA